ncbi:50S ribosomal protein L11 methyltransferase [Flagellimonas allohymeniacidonis]|uniref:Ribosomal protein L11 methyltransferase n=1 Tax=Flagellimonas allohymeniacidonis TaxID=2517819 RepID=A0A4V6MMB8_9FLAO|nr:50S ribosomal protein L11 methyltransferase [Allomuricauda hymeniacidonis]TAI49500.1 50S ribosomal protein L11 methyltransferase [Allomuricauda hymeniacidonis]
MGSIYIEYDFKVSPLQPASEVLIAELGELGFESFVETETGVQAYIQKSDWDDTVLNNLFITKSPEFEISWVCKEIAQQNWNAEWEKSFQPIKVGSSCFVRAPFHEAEAVEFDIVIEPKMSFGTGHHETTYMMLSLILDTDIERKTVLDMGCGTGVLAILAKMKGASAVDAIDIEEWCYLNSLENVERNHCPDIKVEQGDSSLLAGRNFDIILANINRNILLKDIPVYASCMNPHGLLFLSGFYQEDLESITTECERSGFKYQRHIEKNNWVAAVYRIS